MSVKKSKTKIIYIAGTGHCGSTLIDLIMGAAPEVFTTGECSFYNIYTDNVIYNKTVSNYKCTCGKRFLKCEFWRNVRAKLPKIKIKKVYSVSQNIKIALSILLNKDFAKLQDQSDVLFEKIFLEASSRKPKINFILDSSKDPRRLFVLLHNPKLEIYPVFLIREAAAVANSYNKKNRVTEHGLKRKNYFVTLIKWLLINFFINRLIKNNSKTIKIHYNNFCLDPVGHVHNFNHNFNINIPPDFVKAVNQEINHNIDGSYIRFRKLDKIMYDNHWETHLNPIKKLISKPFNLLFKK
jgi:hypothetical protein